METRRQWNDIVKVLEKLFTYIPYPVKISFKDKGKIETFSDEEKQRICCQQILLKKKKLKETLGGRETVAQMVKNINNIRKKLEMVNI